jgi:hypothetical protein
VSARSRTAAQFARQLGTQHTGQSRGKTTQPHSQLDRVCIAAAPGHAPHIRNAFEDTGLGLFAKTFDRRDAMRARRLLERVQRIDPQLVVERADARRAEARNGQQPEQPIRSSLPELQVVARRAGVHELANHGGCGRTYTSDRLQLARARQRREISFYFFDCTRGTRESARLELVLALDLEQRADFIEHNRDRVFIHGRSPVAAVVFRDPRRLDVARCTRRLAR